jgi:hypothetical protein
MLQDTTHRHTLAKLEGRSAIRQLSDRHAHAIATASQSGGLARAVANRFFSLSKGES